MKRLLLAVLLLVGCAPEAKEEDLPPVDALPEGNAIVVAAETLRYGAISLTLDAKVEGRGSECAVHVTVSQTATDDGPIYERLADAWTIERIYIQRGPGAWSDAASTVEGVAQRLEGRAVGAPRLDGDADVVVRLVRKDAPADYLAKRNVPFLCTE